MGALMVKQSAQGQIIRITPIIIIVIIIIYYVVISQLLDNNNDYGDLLWSPSEF